LESLAGKQIGQNQLFVHILTRSFLNPERQMPIPDIFLLIPDTALREAVSEQIKAAKLCAPRAIDQAQDIPDGLLSPVVVIDAQASGKKTEALAQSFCDHLEKPILLVLGGGEEGENVTETFSKPFRLGHLVSRLRYYLEEAPLLRDCVLTFGPYRLEPQNRRVLREDEAPVRLTEKETSLLVFLAQNKGPASRSELLASVWGYDERIDTHTLETHIYQLRKKLDRDGENWLVSDQGFYRLTGIGA
jgi:DNA-binding response OmpR family regulator